MAIEIDTSGDETIIHIQGRFMYADVYRDLRIAYESPEFANAAVKIVNLRGVYGKSKIIPFSGGWRAERKYAGGGILLDQGLHMVDLMRLFCGEFEVRLF